MRFGSLGQTFGAQCAMTAFPSSFPKDKEELEELLGPVKHSDEWLALLKEDDPEAVEKKDSGGGPGMKLRVQFPSSWQSAPWFKESKSSSGWSSSPEREAPSSAQPAQVTPSPARQTELSAVTGSPTSLRKRKAEDAEDEEEEELVWDSNYKFLYVIEKRKKIRKKMEEDPDFKLAE